MRLQDFEIKEARSDRIPWRRVYTHKHTHIRTHIHTDIFQKPCILISSISENIYNMFLQQLKKLLSQSFLQEKAKCNFHHSRSYWNLWKAPRFPCNFYLFILLMQHAEHLSAYKLYIWFSCIIYNARAEVLAAIGKSIPQYLASASTRFGVL